MNRKEFGLLVESWRKFLVESDYDDDDDSQNKSNFPRLTCDMIDIFSDIYKILRQGYVRNGGNEGAFNNENLFIDNNFIEEVIVPNEGSIIGAFVENEGMGPSSVFVRDVMQLDSIEDFLCHSLSSEDVLNNVQGYNTIGKSARKPYYIALDYLRRSIVDGKDYFQYEFYKEIDQLGRMGAHPMQTLDGENVEAYREEQGSFERDCAKYFGSSNSNEASAKKYFSQELANKKYVVYTKSPRGVDQATVSRARSQQDYEDNPFKPYGMWFAPDGEWKRFCETDGFRGDYESKQMLTLNFDNICMIDNDEVMREIDEKYGTGKGRMKSINWSAFANDYDGIIVSSFSSNWTNTWDVVSGCIWSADAIKSTRKMKLDIE
mgnify:FL=1|tara:strand:- start:462 stop:1589 length:1128 start_codon:yes stop_codon:yes gene_type:complete